MVAGLGTTQTLGWASSYYLPALVAAPMGADLGLPVARVFGAFTLGLLVSAVVGPRAGRVIDTWGGRSLLMVTNVLFAAGLSGMAGAQTEWQLWACWALMGLAMGSGLYDAAFATLVYLYPNRARKAITGITLIAGFASTVGWPVTAWAMEQWGWRGACVLWVLAHLCIGLPLHALLPRQPEARGAQAPVLPGDAGRPVPVQATAWPVWTGVALAAVFAITWFTSTAMAAYLPLLLEMQGVGRADALFLSMLVGPAQVLGRLLEFGFLRHVHPLLSARLAAMAHPMGVLLLLQSGGVAGAGLFTGLHGLGNGVLTIAKGTLPLVVFGAQGYGQRQGWLTAPARVAQALAPLLFGLLLARLGLGVLYVTAAMGVLSALALQAVAVGQRPGRPSAAQGAESSG